MYTSVCKQIELHILSVYYKQNKISVLLYTILYNVTNNLKYNKENFNAVIICKMEVPYGQSGVGVGPYLQKGTI